MRLARPPALALACLALTIAVAGLAPATADAEEATSADGGAREAIWLTSRYLPAQAAPPGSRWPLATPAVSGAPLPASPQTSLVARLLEIRLRNLDGPQPADPRARMNSGNVWLRLPLGDAFALGPGVRLDYARHPEAELWTSDPTPTLSVSMRF